MLLALLLALGAPPELRLELVRHSLTGTHCRYREYVAGVPSDTFTVRPCTAASMEMAPRPRRAIRNGRLVDRVIVEESPLEPYAHEYDAETGALLRRVPLFFHAKPARVFDPNPVVALNDPSLQDRNDAASAVPEGAYSNVALDPSPYVTMVDRQDPRIAPPEDSFLFDRSEAGFEYVNASFHIDRNQRRIQSLGYTGERAIAPYAIEVDAHAASGDDNSFFIPSVTRPSRGALFFGDGGTDDAEDADIVVHEYGHALLEWISPGTYSGTFASQSRALSEGFGDYWAYSAHYERRVATGRDPFCFADWDARCWEDDPSENCAYQPGSDCLRRVDSSLTMADYDVRERAGTEHHNGAIWSSALRELHQQLGRDVNDTIVLESLFDAPNEPTFADLARRMLLADQLLYGGTHAEAICGAMTKRGILTTCNEAVPRGERTLFQSSDPSREIPDNVVAGLVSTLTIDDPRTIERIFIRVDVAHPFRSDLRIQLIAPDGTAIVLHDVSNERAADVHATYGLTATPTQSLDILRGRSAAGVWTLYVRDTRPRDVGTLLSWGLVIQFAGDAPLTARPRGAPSQMLPIVTRVYGQDGRLFASDVRIANVSVAPVTATLIFTRSGTSDFAALDVHVAPSQTLALDDVVDAFFHTAGSGTLEILGDVLVMSRTYASGTFGQQVPPIRDTTALGAPPLYVASLQVVDQRVNLGISETAGGSGVVRIGLKEVTITPFSHLQFPVSHGSRLLEVIAGDARIGAYLSEVDEVTGDPMFIPAQVLPSEPRLVIAPVISTEAWTSDLWFHADHADHTLLLRAIGAQRPEATVTFHRTGTFLDVLAQVFHRTVTTAALQLTLPAETFAATRVRGDNHTSQYVPLLTPDGPATQHILFVETLEPYRTNLGIVSDEPALAEVTVFDSAGVAVMHEQLTTAGGVAQVPVSVRVSNGRAVVRFIAGRGRAYGSLVDGRTSDATYVEGQ